MSFDTLVLVARTLEAVGIALFWVIAYLGLRC